MYKSKFRKDLTAMKFAIDVGIENFKKIDNKDNETAGPQLFDLLANIPGVLWVDYNGHFGPYIFVELDAEAANPFTFKWNRIFKALDDTISEYLEE